MRTLFLLLLLTAGAAGTAMAQPASAEARAAFDAGRAAFAQQDYRTAVMHFESARRQGLDTAAVHYNLGVAHYRLGEYANAEAAFRIVADRYPAMRGLAQYNLGLVAERQGRQAAAQQLFAQAAATSNDSTVQRMAQRKLTQRGTPEAASRWFTLIDARFGHDDNVVLVNDALPLPDGHSAESGFAELFAMVSGPLAPRTQMRFDGSLYSVRYADASFLDQNVLYLAAVYQWSWGSWQAEAGPHYGYSTLDGDSLEHRPGVRVRLRRPITAQTSFGVRYVHDEVRKGDDRFADLDGARDSVELQVAHRHAAGRFTFAYAFESNDREGPSVSPNRNKISFQYRHAFSPLWLADVGVSWRRSRYADLADPHTEKLTELAAALTRYLPRGWQIAGSVAVADNDAPLEAVVYDRQRYSVGVSKQF